MSNRLLEELLPGPVTIVLKQKENERIHPSLNPFTDLLGFRVFEDDLYIKEITKEIPVIALTSANVSGGKSPICTDDFLELHCKIDLMIDAGPIPGYSRLGSSIIDLSFAGHYQVIRKGDNYEETVKILQKFNLKFCPNFS